MASTPSEAVARVLRDYQSDKKPHDKIVADTDRYYRAYRGLMESRSKAAEWTSKLTPAYAWQIIEVLTANVVDPKPRWSVKPRPRLASPDDIALVARGARANEILLMNQVDNDRFAEKQMPFAKQAFIAGFSVFKTSWAYEEGVRARQQVQVEVDSETGIHVPRLRQVHTTEVRRDDPTVEVVDVRDWIPQEGATSLKSASRVTHRVWYSFDELKRLEAHGVYGKDAGGDPVDKLKETRDQSTPEGLSAREEDLFATDRTKDKIEVLEQWSREPDGSIRVRAIANKAILLRDRPSPFAHGEFPFVVCAPIPDIGRIQGISVMEQVVDLQEAAWSFLNQRLDNTELLNNAVVLIREDVDDLEQFEWAPGAQWVVQDPQQVSLLQVSPLPAEISLRAEEMIKQDLQNIPGASPTLLGQTDQSAQTATEISLSTSLAQRRVALMKQQFKWAYKHVGEQWMELNQQFIDRPRAIATIGPDGAQAFEDIHPLLLQGDFYIALEAMDESLMRQERRAEAQAKLQVALNAAQFFAAIPGQPGLNLKRFMDDFLESYDTDDKDAYYSAAPQPQVAPQQGPQQQQTPDQGQGGVTAPQAYDATSPSNATSLSPMAALQRMGAMAGGPVNQ